MKNINYKIHGELLKTDYVMKNTFWIGLQPSLTNDMKLKRSCDEIKKILK